MKKSIFIAWIITFFLTLIYLLFSGEGILLSFVYLFLISLIFFIYDIKDKNRLKYYNHIMKVLISCLIPGFALYSAWIFLAGYAGQNISPDILIGWYILLFVVVDLVIVYPTFSILAKNKDSIFS